MAKFLVRATYSAEGFKGVVKDKPSGRKAAVEKAMASVGAKLEAMYFAFGDHDVVMIVDAPDAPSLMAVGLSACSTGLARTSTTPLLTVEEADQAVKKTVQYRGPGQ
jgi:uncharacterized protein with GYD domain